MAVVLSRRGFLGGVLASMSIAALPLPDVASNAVRTAEPLTAPVVPQPFHVILDEFGYYMPDDLGSLADALRFELCANVDVETELSESADVGRACVAALRNSLDGRGMPQEALLVRRNSHMATVV
ncbi:hypothetical protein OIU34_21775 [Pararhizobium sp. BT-229]|uniref:hypothetical protein n=1 Tax=Pararhizobium sp. BT-229 TaxID=2986923 RepID=UPI0021F77402|nr:hypothetical protein [Pararhizobium sp. BT-229]MCV9964523.1 hypothetical protein [Pararhizobium sp. BT-229]